MFTTIARDIVEQLKKTTSIVITDLKTPIFSRENLLFQKILAFGTVYLIADSNVNILLKVPSAFAVYLYSVEGFTNTALLSVISRL